jgi:Putative zinc-finger
MSSMDHEQIDRSGLIDLYLMGKLPAEESAGFEEHFLDCPQCVARLQTTKNFLQDLRLVAAHQAAQPNNHRPERAPRHFLQLLSRKPLAIAFACLLLAAVAGAVFVINHIRLLRAEADQAKRLSEQWERRYEAEHQSAIATDRKYQETELQQTERLRALEAKVNDEEAQRAKMAVELNRRTQTEGELSIFALTAVRGGDLNSSETVNKITLSPSPALFAFSIRLEGEVQFDNYRITIFDANNRLVRRLVGLRPDRHGSLSMWFKSDFLRPGHYSLIVEGIKKKGGREEVGNYPLRVIKSR